MTKILIISVNVSTSKYERRQLASGHFLDLQSANTFPMAKNVQTCLMKKVVLLVVVPVDGVVVINQSRIA